jgi:hypothetical protein
MLILKTTSFFLIQKTVISKLLFNTLFLIIVIAHALALILVSKNINDPYIFWSQLGTGTMFKNGELFYWGDLAHIFSAVNCDTQVYIGKNICDPFERVFNQNPHIVLLFKQINLESLLIVGLVSTFIFYVVFYKFSLIDFDNGFMYLVLLITPPVILALDRGNEIITFILLSLGIALLRETSRRQTLGGLILFVAAFFKLWPIVFITFILVTCWKKLNQLTKIMLVASITYWVLNIGNAFSMIKQTAVGSPLSLSFGLRHYINGRIPLMSLFLLSSLVFFLVVKYVNMIKSYRIDTLVNSLDREIFYSLMLTYIFIWSVGTNYIYRLVILIPIMFYISKSSIPSKLKSNILALFLGTFITSGLTVNTVLTSTIAFIFIYIVIRSTKNFLVNRMFNK